MRYLQKEQGKIVQEIERMTNCKISAINYSEDIREILIVGPPESIPSAVEALNKEFPAYVEHRKQARKEQKQFKRQVKSISFFSTNL